MKRISHVINITSQLVSVEGKEDRADVELKLPPPSCRVFPLVKMRFTHVSCGFGLSRP